MNEQKQKILITGHKHIQVPETCLVYIMKAKNAPNKEAYVHAMNILSSKYFVDMSEEKVADIRAYIDDTDYIHNELNTIRNILLDIKKYIVIIAVILVISFASGILAGIIIANSQPTVDKSPWGVIPNEQTQRANLNQIN